MGDSIKYVFARRIILPALLFFSLSIISTSSSASPWARTDGEILIISRAEYFSTDLTPANVGEPIGQFQRLESNNYFEYGLTESVTIGGKAIYGTTWLNNAAVSQSQSGFSELEGFGQYQILRSNKHAVSIRVAAATPVQLQSGARTSLMGKGVDLDFSALYGRDLLFKPVKIFTAAELGYRKNIGENADQIRTQITFGIEPHRRVLVLVEAFGTMSMQNHQKDGADFDIVKLQPSLVIKATERWSIQAGLNREVAGRNLELGRTFFIGLWSRF